MTASAAQKEISRLVAAGQFRFSLHSLQRMDERGLLPADVRHSLIHLTKCVEARDGCFKVAGVNLDGTNIVSVVRIVGDVLVVTLYKARKRK